MEKARPKKRRPENLDGTLEQCLLVYKPVLEKVGELIQLHWSWSHWIPCIEEEIRATMDYVFIKAYRDRDLKPGLFPTPPELLYTRTRWALVKQWVPRESIHRYHVLAPYDTLEHWNPSSPEFIASNEQCVGKGDDNIFPYDVKPDMLDWWYLGLTTIQIGMIYNVTDRTVRKHIQSFYDAIESVIDNPRPDTEIPLAPPVPRPRQGRSKEKTPSI